MKGLYRIIIILCFFYSCNIAKNKLNDANCNYLKKRNTVSKVEGVGVVVLNRYGDYLIKPINENFFYNPCNLPEKMKKEKLNVKYKGDEKEFYPNEKTVGRFLILTDITIVKK